MREAGEIKLLLLRSSTTPLRCVSSILYFPPPLIYVDTKDTLEQSTKEHESSHSVFVEGLRPEKRTVRGQNEDGRRVVSSSSTSPLGIVVVLVAVAWVRTCVHTYIYVCARASLCVKCV